MPRLRISAPMRSAALPQLVRRNRVNRVFWSLTANRFPVHRFPADRLPKNACADEMKQRSALEFEALERVEFFPDILVRLPIRILAPGDLQLGYLERAVTVGADIFGARRSYK